MEHLLWLNWSFIPLIHKKQAISDATNRILEFWLQILNQHETLILKMYNMLYSGVFLSVPFLVIIIVFFPVRTTDQIWWYPFQIPYLCEISHLLTCKSSHVKHVIRLPSINLYYFNLLFIGYPKALLIVTSSIIQYSKTILIEFHQNRILMMFILNNVTKQPPDCIKNIMVEIIFKIDV